MDNNILPFEYRQSKGRSHQEGIRKGQMLFEAFQAIIESTSDSIFLADREGRYILVNQAYSSRFGLPIDHIIGKKYSDLHSPEESKRYYECIEKVFLTGESQQQEYLPEEGTRTFLQTFSPVRSSGPAKEITSVSVIAKDITHSRYMEKALQTSEEKTRNLLESIDDSYYEVDLQGNFTFLNRSAKRRIGENSRRYHLDANFRKFISDEDSKRMLNVFNEVYRTGMARSEIPLDFATDIGFRNLEISVSPIKDAQNGIVGFRGISRDVTDRNTLLERVRQSEERYRNIVENIEDGYYEIDLTGHPLFCNDAYLKILGYSRQEWLDTHFTNYIDADTTNRLNSIFMRILQTGMSRSGIEWAFTAKDGQVKNLEETVSLIKDVKGNPIGFRGLARDVTKRKNHDAMIKHLAYHDSLTGLPNRLLFFDRIHMALEQAKRNKQSLAVMEIDLDGFKTVNDSYGHHIGDLLLQSVAGLLKNAVRKSDTVARMGGDEFIILLPEIKEEPSTGKIAAKILKAFDQCFQLDGQKIYLTPSIGIAVFPEHGQDADHLIKHADNAMYRVKESGKNNYRI